jgi:hypothetical protein
MMSTSPTQNVGRLKPASEERIGLQARDEAQRDADRDGEDHRAEGELERGRQPLDDELDRRHVEDE